MEDNRLINRLKTHWETLRGKAEVPAWEHFNPSVIGDVWHQCCAWRVEASQQEKFVYTYIYMGSGVREAIGLDLTGTVLVSSVKYFPGARIVEKIDNIVRQKTLLLEESQFVNESSKVVKYRSCLLPFGPKNRHVSNVLLGLSWRTFG